MKPTYLYGAVALVVVVIAGVVLAVLLTRGSNPGDGGTTASPYDQAQQLQQQLGADSCSNSGAAIENQRDGSRLIIYDCAFGARRRCVTVGNGIARDATADVKRLFANSQGARRPKCAIG